MYSRAPRLLFIIVLLMVDMSIVVGEVSERINVDAMLNNMILISQVQTWHSFIGQKSCDTGHPCSPMNSNPDLPDCLWSLSGKLSIDSLVSRLTRGSYTRYHDELYLFGEVASAITYANCCNIPMVAPNYKTIVSYIICLI